MPATISHLSFPSSVGALSDGSVSTQRDGVWESEADAASRNDDLTLTATVPMDVPPPATG